VAEWLRNGLQNRVPRFNSGRGLQDFAPLGPLLNRLSRHGPRGNSRRRRCFCRGPQVPGPMRARAALKMCEYRYAADNCCYAITSDDSSGIPAYIEFQVINKHEELLPMTTIALSQLVHQAPAFLSRIAQRITAFLDGIEEARLMAQRFKSLSEMTDAQLAARGLRREEIPQAVLDHSIHA